MAKLWYTAIAPVAPTRVSRTELRDVDLLEHGPPSSDIGPLAVRGHPPSGGDYGRLPRRSGNDSRCARRSTSSRAGLRNQMTIPSSCIAPIGPSLVTNNS